MMGAVSLMYGGAPAGPAGTGKTETVKDLAKSVAIQCVVFNCSDGLDFRAMAKFFKGLASSGAWACFDEFNRIELEVLSVIAQQLLVILRAKRQRMKSFDFEGSHITLNPDCNSFITMNPGYAGRSELPENLKALYRPCAMMVPNYALIAEIKLYSFGFQRGLDLSRKVTQVLKICSEQLSAQKHYDYGMRAVFSILVRAGKLREMRGGEGGWTEDMIALSAVVDVNLPKFNQSDLPLFKGIVSDLFPGVKLPKADYGPLEPTIRKVTTDRKLQQSDEFITSVVQLYETVQVRHGLMVVGETLAAKSNIIHTLATAMSSIENHPDFCNVTVRTMNPKSITSGQLYGDFDENTHEWSDGILAIVYRQCSKAKIEDGRQWIVFDGPVDTLWIESLNTVLDDNRKLCLISGEIIKMSPLMTIMFETQDLEEASPATVSRVGMVYVEQSRLGWKPFLMSWIQFELGDKYEEEIQNHIRDLVLWIFPVMCDFALRNIDMPVPITKNELIRSLLKLMSILVHENNEIILEKRSSPQVALTEIFLFSLIWTVGAQTSIHGRQRFGDYLTRLLEGDLDGDDIYRTFAKKNPVWADDIGHDFNRRLEMTLPWTAGDDLTPYDFYLEVSSGKWKPWMSLPDAKFRIEDGASFSDIIVPTIDTVRQTRIMTTYILNNTHVLCTGDTGTGKSVTVVKYLQQLSPEKWSTIFVNFSAQTSENMTQDIIDAQMIKRRKGVFGPSLGKNAIIFVDDLNMPVKEVYGAQPPIETLRQSMSQGGWYDRETQEFKSLVSIQYVAAMGPPGGGRTQITSRMMRHFSTLMFTPFEASALKGVFTSILRHFYKRYDNNQIKSWIDPVVNATVDVYNSISEALRPTPKKLHYTYNLRDISKVMQGMCQVSCTNLKTKTSLVKLFGHECTRVFHDRLINDEDREWFMKCLERTVKTHLKENWTQTIANEDKNHVLLFGSFVDQTDSDNPEYKEMTCMNELRESAVNFLQDYNAINKKKMDLVLFMNAIEHCARISRVLNLPKGNALLVGGGVARSRCEYFS